MKKIKIEKYMQSAFSPIIKTDKDGLEIKHEKVKQLRDRLILLRDSLKTVKEHIVGQTERVVVLRKKIADPKLKITKELPKEEKERRIARKKDLKSRLTANLDARVSSVSRREYLKNRVITVRSRLDALREKIGRIRSNRIMKQELKKRLRLKNKKA